MIAGPLLVAPAQRRMLSVSAVKRQLGVRYDTALRLVASGKIPGERGSRGRWKIPQASVDAYIRSIADRLNGVG